MSGAAESVTLSVSGVPAGATASFSPSSVTSGGSSTLTINAGTAAPGSYTLTVTGTAPSATHSTSGDAHDHGIAGLHDRRVACQPIGRGGQ